MKLLLQNMHPLINQLLKNTTTAKLTGDGIEVNDAFAQEVDV